MDTVDAAIEAVRAVLHSDEVALTAEDRHDLNYTIGLLVDYLPSRV